MPVVSRQKKCTTTNSTDSTQGQDAPRLPEQQEFHQHLRTLARSAVRVVIEEVMREELDQFIGVAWGECSRQQQRVPQWSLQSRSGHLHRSDRGHQRPQGS